MVLKVKKGEYWIRGEMESSLRSLRRRMNGLAHPIPRGYASHCAIPSSPNYPTACCNLPGYKLGLVVTGGR